jgi:NAD(P)-dependent dehydrogenase (short-subunit alcohol dehydrogenase family)
MAGLVDDKVVLVTGAGSGIGRASAVAFAQEGARSVVVADRDPDGGNETVELIRTTGADAQFVACDVTDAAQVDAMVAATVESYGRLDCAHNNAGISLAPRGFTAVRLDQWQRVLNVNLKGVWLCLRAEIRHMLTRDGGGAIVNTASAAGIIGTPGNPAYAATKHAVLGLTKTAALEYIRKDIRVNAVCPGAVRTPLVEPALEIPELATRLLGVQPGGRLAEPEEVAAAVVWLASDRASFVSGEGMLVAAGAVTR